MRSKSPQLPFTSINPSLLLRQVQKEKFPSIKTVVDVFFVNMKPLACIVQFGKRPDNKTIFIHEILNRIETPLLVLEHIITHEFIHILIKEREINGKLSSHPPEFWEEEKKLSPNRQLAWNWIFANFLGIIINDKKNEETKVHRLWKKNFVNDIIPLDQITE
ncbi:hypothetical protein N9D02_11540 [Emcibacteraceae bacterium]|nr:hypothetical protein [Emcibacteraceae bacterium]